VICDININGAVNGIDLARQLKELYQCEVVFLTAYTDTKTLQAAFNTEPVMYVVKPYTDTQLLVAIQMAFHKIFQARQIVSEQQTLQLTDREREIALLIAQGLSSKQIARNLSISVETVKTHRRRILKKNNINNFPQLIYLLHAGVQQ
jgi:DNA-binding NarL/FixJ family response regulator